MAVFAGGHQTYALLNSNWTRRRRHEIGIDTYFQMILFFVSNERYLEPKPLLKKTFGAAIGRRKAGPAGLKKANRRRGQLLCSRLGRQNLPPAVSPRPGSSKRFGPACRFMNWMRCRQASPCRMEKLRPDARHLEGHGSIAGRPAAGWAWRIRRVRAFRQTRWARLVESWSLEANARQLAQPRPQFGLGGAVPLSTPRPRWAHAKSRTCSAALNTGVLFLMSEAWRIVKMKHAATAFSGKGAATREPLETRGRGGRLCQRHEITGRRWKTFVHLNPPVRFKWLPSDLQFDDAVG